MFIAFEGIDGSGKDTQLKKCINFLIDENKHRMIVKCREPSSMTTAGKKLNTIAQEHIILSDMEVATLFAQDRRDLEEFRREILRNTGWIIASRCDISTYVYQHTLGYETIYDLHENILCPDVVFFLDISVETMIERLGTREGARELYEEEHFLRKCHTHYHAVIDFLRNKGRTIITIDGEGTPDIVATRVRNELQKYLQK